LTLCNTFSFVTRSVRLIFCRVEGHSWCTWVSVVPSHLTGRGEVCLDCRRGRCHSLHHSVSSSVGIRSVAPGFTLCVFMTVTHIHLLPRLKMHGTASTFPHTPWGSN
jgi:hypothetical protein